jgi:molecular chaperone GrpE
MVKKTQTSKISAFQEAIEQYKTLASVSEEKYLRTLADYQNQDRRFKEAQSQIVKFANATLIEKILLNIDSLELAQSHIKDAGLDMVIKQLQETLKTEGLQLIESDDKPFDPLTMDCIEVVPGKKDQVITTLTKGYFLFDKVLRPAKVKVGSGEK